MYIQGETDIHRTILEINNKVNAVMANLLAWVLMGSDIWGHDTQIIECDHLCILSIQATSVFGCSEMYTLFPETPKPLG
jgi:hypothetical protein